MNGARIPLLDMVKNLVGIGLAARIPPNGWSPDQIHKMTDGTKFDGAGVFADWACQATHCVMLDTNYENCEYVEGMGEPLFKWTLRNVELLAKQWPKVVEIRKKIDHIVEWLEADQIVRFKELLEYLLTKIPNGYSEKNNYHADPWDYICKLDTKGDDDDKEEE